MSHAHHGHDGVDLDPGRAPPAPHAHAAQPTLSLLRWSAGQRVLAAAGVVALLWAWVAATLA